MVSLTTPVADFGLSPPDFCLPGVDGRDWTLSQCMGENGLLVMFICNHCPYVIAVRDRIVRDTNELKNFGIAAVAIMSNDSTAYPEDSFANMQCIAESCQFGFPYLLDDSQAVAKAYGAVCTPDFFGYHVSNGLQYRGRLDASRKQAAPADTIRDLFTAMKGIAVTGKGPVEQIPSIGCSIKWKPDSL